MSEYFNKHIGTADFAVLCPNEEEIAEINEVQFRINSMNTL